MSQFKECPIRPFGKARPRVTRNGTFMPKDYTSKKNALRMMFGPVDEYDNIKLWVIAVRSMPKSWGIKKRKEMSGCYCTTRPDIDNIIGAVMDALFPDDDSTVVLVSGAKLWGYDDAIKIEIAEVSAT